MNRLCVHLLAVAVVGLALPAAAQDATDSAPLIAAVEAAAPGALARYDTPGVAVAMVLDGAPVWSAGFGVADVRTGAPVTADTVFEIASVTKPVTAWAVLKLSEQQHLDLDVPIETYLDGWTLPPSDFDPSLVTARTILAHAAGLSTGGDSGVGAGEAVPTLLEAADGATMEYGAIQISHPPGEAYHYSSKGFVLLEMAVENVTGETFANFVTREVLEPLGMDNSAFGWTPALEERAAGGHDWYGRPLPHYRHATKAQGGLVATAGDVARFVAASMKGADGAAPGRGVISAEAVQTTFTPYPFEMDNSTVGLGYNLHLDGDVLIARKSGDHRGYKAIVFSMPEIGAGLVILANSDRAAPGIFADIACPWSKAMPADPMRRVCRQLQTLRNVHWAGGGLFAIAGLLIALRLGRGLKQGARDTSLKISALRWSMVTFLVIALIAWWSFWYSDIPLRLRGFPPTFYTVRATLWPTAFVWVSVGLSALVFVILLALAFPKRRASRSA